MLSIPEGKSLILFDGECMLCNRFIQFILRYDKNKSFLIAPLQAPKAQQLIQLYNIKIKQSNIPDSVILIQNGKVYDETTAVLIIASQLDGAVKYLSVLKIIPKLLRDPFYRLIAKYRYRWFGKTEQCFVASVYADRFWDDV